MSSLYDRYCTMYFREWSLGVEYCNTVLTLLIQSLYFITYLSTTCVGTYILSQLQLCIEYVQIEIHIRMAAWHDALLWTLIFIGFFMRLNPKNLEHLTRCNLKTDDLGFYSRSDTTILPKRDYALNWLKPDPASQQEKMTDKRNSNKIIATCKKNITNGFILMILMSVVNI